MEIVALLTAVITIALAVMDSRKANAPERRDKEIDRDTARGNDALGGRIHATLDRLRRHNPERF